MNNYEEQICKAIDIILKKRFSDLKFNKTIFATIIKAKEDIIPLDVQKDVHFIKSRVKNIC